MAKRMILMVVLVVVFIAALGFVKFKQIPGHGGAVRGVAAAARSGDDDRRAAQEEWPATLSAIGTVAAVQGVTVSADLPGIVDRIALRVRASRSARATCSSQLDTRQEQAQLAAAEAQRELARAQLRADAGPADERVDLAGRVRSRGRRTQAGGRAGRRDPRRRSSARRSARRSPASSASARSTSAST